MWLEAKNIHSNQPSEKLDQKRYRPFRTSNDIRQRVFQLELPKGWAIYNMFNEDLLIQCREPHFKEQHMDPAPSPEIINEERKYEIEEI